MSGYIDKKYTVTCTIKLTASYNSRCKDKDDALECFLIQYGNDLIEQFKGHDVSFGVVEHEKTILVEDSGILNPTIHKGMLESEDDNEHTSSD